MARPGVKHLGTLCVVDNTLNKAGLGAGPRPAQMGGPSARPSGWGRARGERAGSVEGLLSRQPPPGGFHKYLLNKETTAFAFPVIVALGPPHRVRWEAPSLHGPFLPPLCRPVPGRLDGSSGRSQGRTLGSPRALQSGTQAPPSQQAPAAFGVRTSSSASTWAPAQGCAAESGGRAPGRRRVMEWGPGGEGGAQTPVGSSGRWAGILELGIKPQGLRSACGVHA